MCFLDAPLQIVVNEGFLPFILEAEQEASTLRILWAFLSQIILKTSQLLRQEVKLVPGLWSRSASVLPWPVCSEFSLYFLDDPELSFFFF